MTRSVSVALWLATAYVVGLVAWACLNFTDDSMLAPLSLAILAPPHLVASLLDHYFAWEIDYRVLVPVLPAFGYLALSAPTALGKDKVPIVSVVVFFAVAVADVAFFVVLFDDGLRHQGTAYTVSLALLNLVFIAALARTLVQNRRSPSSLSAYLFHAGLFLWITWLSFPWLGEGA